MGVGDEVRSMCGRCGETWHLVIALVDGRVAKVECGECHAQHRYRVAGGAASRAAPRRAARSGATRRPRDVIEADPARPVRPFRTSETFSVGDRLAHPTLGEGVVQALAGPTKIEVLFGNERKLLVHARK